jgi:hypothetical protein
MIVHPGSDAVDGADKRAWPASHHAQSDAVLSLARVCA